MCFKPILKRIQAKKIVLGNLTGGLLPAQDRFKPSALSAIPLGKTHDQVDLAHRTGFEASCFRSPASGAPVVPPPVPVRAVCGVPIWRPSSSHTGLPAAQRGFKHIAWTVSALRWTMSCLEPRLLCHEVTSQRCPEQLWVDLAARGQYGHENVAWRRNRPAQVIRSVCLGLEQMYKGGRRRRLELPTSPARSYL